MGCSVITLRKLEAEERRPSKQIAERLGEALQVALDARAEFLRFARGDPFAATDAFQTPDQPNQKPRPRHNLPPELTSFIGRKQEIEQIGRLVSQQSGGRLLTLTGPGGTGKTRLALQAAASLVDIFSDGVWLIELGPLADPELVARKVATVMGLRDAPGRRMTDLLVDNLRAKQLLLVLDNCEHLIQACAELAEKLLNTCPHLTILATSREALGVAGERPFPVSSLSMPDEPYNAAMFAISECEAVHLFVERANAVLPGFAMDNRNAFTITTICQQLDGNPLAIELAAARMQLLTVEQIANRLDNRFELLSGGRRTDLPRHRTLAAMIDWSYDLLSEPERVLLRRLSVFAGGWTLEAAEAVGGDSDLPVLDVLTRLVNKSFVVAERRHGQESRYKLLESIRHYALAKLAASSEAAPARQRHAACYLALAELLTDPIHPTLCEIYPGWLERMELEIDNLRVALRWSQSPQASPELALRLAAAAWTLWWGHGLWREGQTWLEDALARPGADGAECALARATVLVKLGYAFGLQGEYAAGLTQLTKSLAIFQCAGDRRWSAYVLAALGWTAREHGDANTARLRLEESLALYRDLGDDSGLGDTLNTLGEVAVMMEDTAWARTLLEQALALNRTLPRNENNISWSLNHLGHAAQLQGDYQQAARHHQESLAQFRELGELLGIAYCDHGLGETALAQGNAALALGHLRAALASFRDMGDRAGMAWCLAGLAGAAVLVEEPERAAWLWGAGEALRQSIGARDAPASRATRERLIAAARDQLGEAAFTAHWVAGGASPLTEAVERALS